MNVNPLRESVLEMSDEQVIALAERECGVLEYAGTIWPRLIALARLGAAVKRNRAEFAVNVGAAAAPGAVVDDEMGLQKAELTPIHIKLLRRGVASKWIGLSDDMAIHMSEVAALGELRRMGFVEDAKGPFPPGPSRPTPSIITEAGRDAITSINGGK